MKIVFPNSGELIARIDTVLSLVITNLRRIDLYRDYWPTANIPVGRLEDKVASEVALFLLLVGRIESLSELPP